MTRAMHYLQAGTVVLLLAAILAAGENTGTQPDRDGADLLTAHPLLLGAHRCGRHEWPENTLVAVREAAKRWPEALLEVDAQLSSDGQVVLMHDFDVDRTTGGTVTWEARLWRNFRRWMPRTTLHRTAVILFHTGEAASEYPL